MTAVFNWIFENLRNFMVPVCLLCVLRIVVCKLEMGRIKHLRENKDRFLSEANQIREIGAEIGVLIGGVIAVIVPRFWFVTLPLSAVLGVIGYRKAAVKAQASDDYWREVAKERQRLRGDALETTQVPALEHGVDGIFNAAADYGEPAEKKESPAPVEAPQEDAASEDAPAEAPQEDADHDGAPADTNETKENET